jgi:hypothetical protein
MEVAERELTDELLGAASLLVDLDRLPGAHHPQLGVGAADPGLRAGCFGIDDEDGVTRPDARLGRAPERVAKLGCEGVPVLQRIAREQGQLACPARGAVAIDGDAGAVRAAVAHLGEHGREVPSEPLLDFGRLREQPDDATHMFSIYIRFAPRQPIFPTIFQNSICSFLT